MIRPATRNDLPRLVELSQMMHELTNYSPRPLDAQRVERFFGTLIDGEGVIFVADIDGDVVGGIAGATSENWYDDAVFAYEIALFLEPKRRHGITAVKLVRAFIRWAELRGATRVEAGITTSTGVEGTSRLYESLGFKAIHPAFQMEI